MLVEQAVSMKIYDLWMMTRRCRWMEVVADPGMDMEQILALSWESPLSCIF